MAKEYHRMDLVVGVRGIEGARTKLRAYDKAVGQARKNTERLNKAKASPTVKVKDEATKKVSSIDKALKSLSKKAVTVAIKGRDLVTGMVGRIKRSVFSLSTAMGGAFGLATAGGLTWKMLDAGSFEEQAKVSLKVMLKSKKLADEMYAQGQRFGDLTPFQTREVIGAEGTLISSRFKPAEIFKGGLLRDVGDLAAVNQDIGASITDVSNVFARLKSGDFGEAFERLRELKISKQSLIEQGLKFSKSGEYQGTVDKALTAVRKIIQRDFGGLMNEQSKTWGGLWSTLESQADNVLGKIAKHEVRRGVTVLDLFKNRAKQITALIIDDEGKLTPMAQKFIANVGEGFRWLDNKITDIMSGLKRRYLDNPAFQKLDFNGKIKFVMDDVSTMFQTWWDGGGSKAASGLGSKIGSVMISGATAGAVSAVSKSPLLQLFLGAYAGAKVPGPPILKVGVAISIIAGSIIWDALEQLRRDPEIGVRVHADTVSGFKGNTPQEGRSYMPNTRDIGSAGRLPNMGAVLKTHARGGTFYSPHAGLVAEEGTETIIPHNPKHRRRAAALWQQAGSALGMGSAGVRAVNVGQVNLNWEADEEALALKIGMAIINEAKLAMDNMA